MAAKCEKCKWFHDKRSEKCLLGFYWKRHKGGCVYYVRKRVRRKLVKESENE